MFGMGFMEIFLILIVAVIALGPEKLPTAAVDIAKMFKKLKGGFDDAKSTLHDELNISELSDLKNDAYKIQSSIKMDRLASLELDDILEDDKPKKKKKSKKNETVIDA